MKQNARKADAVRHKIDDGEKRGKEKINKME